MAEGLRVPDDLPALVAALAVHTDLYLTGADRDVVDLSYRVDDVRAAILTAWRTVDADWRERVVGWAKDNRGALLRLVAGLVMGSR